MCYVEPDVFHDSFLYRNIIVESFYNFLKLIINASIMYEINKM